MGSFLLLLLFSSIFIYCLFPGTTQPTGAACRGGGEGAEALRTNLPPVCQLFFRSTARGPGREIWVARGCETLLPCPLRDEGKVCRAAGAPVAPRGPRRDLQPPTAPFPARSGAAGRQPPAPAAALPIQNPQHHLLGSRRSALSPSRSGKEGAGDAESDLEM